MTCIVAITENDKVYMGADSASVAADYITRSAVPKLFYNPPFLIGYTSSWRMGQILEHHLRFNDLKSPRVGDSLQGFMVCEFVEPVRKAFKNYGYAEQKDNQETGGTFLVGYHGHLFYVGDDYQVNETTNGMDACGCGLQVALGALYASKDTRLNPFQRLDIALEAAAYYCTSVSSPFHIMSLALDGTVG